MFFADDAFLFFKPTTLSCQNVMDVVARFSCISGEQINLKKSYVKCSPNTPFRLQRQIKSLLRIPRHDNVGIHLGVPIDLKNTTANYSYIVDKFIQRLTSWNSTYLSVPAKLVLINVSLVSIASHIMSTYLLPISITNKLDSIVSHFLWSSRGHKGIHWKSKECIHLPKGLGVRCVKCLIKPFL